MIKYLLLLNFLINTSHAAFMIDTNTSYSSSNDTKTKAALSDMSNHIFIGASLGAKQQLYVGQNVTSFTHQLKTTSTDKINTLELGPRLIYFFTDENVFYATLGWNPYAKGKRTVSGSTDQISGFGLLGGIGAELKINRNFHVGASFTYKSLNISESINSSNVAKKESNTYTTMMPMLNLSFRFR